MISEQLMTLVRCPECRNALTRESERVVCAGCGRQYRAVDGAYLDLRPSVEFAEQTKYLDDALHADARHERVSAPLLGSRIRNDMLRTFLSPGPGDRLLDLGCGSGRTLIWNADSGAAMVGIDISPFFAQEARARVDLLLGDLRTLPFADGTFTKACSLDVLEHLSPDALRAMLGEAARVLAPGAGLFVYSHVRKNAPIAAGLRWINGLARQLERIGLIDMRQERLRKSDHLNPLKDVAELEQVARAAGFRIARIRFYTPIVGGLIENILMRLVERALTRRAARRVDGNVPREEADRIAARETRTAAKQQIARNRATYAVLRALSAVMKIDLVLFGRITSGPFFVLLVKE
jgi:SAM-dependent methyltransferase